MDPLSIPAVVGQPVTGGVMRRLVAQLSSELALRDERITAVDVSPQVAEVREQVAELESSAVRVTVVATVNDLPAEASLLEWFRVEGDSALYIGDGEGNQLRVVTTASLP